MNTADRVLEELDRARGAFVSGSDVGKRLGIGRNAVWKAVKALEERGYPVEGVPRRGYRLDPAASRLSAASVKRCCDLPELVIEFHDTIASTNDRAKELAASGAAHGTLVVADCQTSGKGRQGRPFYSPAGCGVYFSLCLRPEFSLEDISSITSFAAVCTASAIEEVFGLDAQIKWVNDVFVDGRKVCGILTEAAVQPESGQVDYVVCGIGINVAEPPEGWPPELEGVAHALCGPGEGDVDDRRSRLVAATVRAFLANFGSIPELPHLAEYRRRSLLDGRRVRVETAREAFDALVIGVDERLRLEVRLPDGSTRHLVHGEVHIPSEQL